MQKKPDIQLLYEVIRKQQPQLIHLLTLLGNSPLTIEQRESLREAIATELSETGLNEFDEPNERGLYLEDMISYLGHL